jgi:hypothetical protein
VRLIDPVELHVAQARKASGAGPDAPLAGAEVGDARELPAADRSADAVLLLGPIYHLPEAADRDRACARRAACGARAAACSPRRSRTSRRRSTAYATPSSTSPLRGAGREHDLRADRNPDGRPGWFTTAFPHRPEQLAAEIEGAGFALEALLAIEGVAHYARDTDAWLDEPARRDPCCAIRRVEAEPALLGASPMCPRSAGLRRRK